MRRQLVPGPVVRLTVIKAKTRPGIEATENPVTLDTMLVLCGWGCGQVVEQLANVLTEEDYKGL